MIRNVSNHLTKNNNNNNIKRTLIPEAISSSISTLTSTKASPP